MYVGTNDLAEQGYVFVRARTFAAAAVYASKDKSRPVLGAVEITTDENGKVGATATDSYRLGHFESMPFSPVKSKPEVNILLDVAELGKFVSASPKVTEWLAIRETERYGQMVIEVTKLNTDTSSDSIITMGQTTYVQKVDGNFPDWKQLVGNTSRYTDSKQQNVGPNLNTNYVNDCLKSMNIAVSYTGPASTSFIHGDEVTPIIFESANEAGEYGLVLLMPIRSDERRTGKMTEEIRHKAWKAHDELVQAKKALEKENIKLKNELDALKATLAEIEAGKAA